MKVVIHFEFPIEPFNSLVRDGTAGRTIAATLEAIAPEAVYFYAPNGCRGGVMVVDIDDPARIPAIAEPLFLQFEARCEFHAAMTPDDLARAGLGELGQRWG